VDTSDYIIIKVAVVVGVGQNVSGTDIITKANIKAIHMQSSTTILLHIIGLALVLNDTVSPTLAYTQVGNLINFILVIGHTFTSSGTVYLIEIADYFEK
jgi:type III secretion system FlhB-like substrate exporter